MQASAALRLTPFAPYHWLMYARSMWFDIEHVREQLGWTPALVDRRDVRPELRLVRRPPGGGLRRTPAAPRPTGAPPAPARSALLKHLTGFLPPVR